ncbi:uncharacterized protein LOC121235616 isoform X1 [Juglans microcarpa x Juglans regia]|uniref:uncharacterized protein LOC121235616 isoform X1 n=1 Tax=Juglans microcarpa x Juglans regia TaxID=2249226 RepID=UPI001B7EB381|nr:uncharacterized protein LOC121235616 isoform X1 [Juglans microcarpa x Juglans regia]
MLLAPVLKAHATVPDKTLSPSTPMFDQQATEASPSGSSLRVTSLRQLSNNFAQFNNVQIPLRSRKPLTRKDAAAINEWRFSKLKEYKDRNIEVEDEAFDRYMQNISLLEEVFLVKSIIEGSIEDESSVSNPNATSLEANTEMLVSGLKLRLRSNAIRADNFKQRIQQIVHQGLKKLQKPDLNDGINEPSDQDEPNEGPKKAKIGKKEKASVMSDLIDKLNKARNEEDLKSCLEMKLQLFNQDTVSSKKEIQDAAPKDQIPKVDSEPRKELPYSLKKLISTTEIDEETLNRIDAHFSSLEQIHRL